MRISDWSSDVCSSDLEQSRILRAVPAKDRVILEQGLTFPEDSAGRLMQRELVVVPAHWTVGQTIDFLRTVRDLPDDFYAIYVVDPAHRPVGELVLSHLLRTKRPVRVSDMRSEEHTSELQSLMRISYAVFCLKKKILHNT